MSKGRVAKIASGDPSTMTLDALKSELAKCLTLTAAALSRASEIYTELVARGENLSDLRSGLALYLPRIARGELAAEAVVAFAGQRTLLHRLIGTDLELQRRWAAGEPVELAERTGAGTIVAVKRPLTTLNAREVLLVLGDGGGVRPLPAQVASLAREKPPKRKPRSATVRADVPAGRVRVGRASVEPAKLADALRDLGWAVNPPYGDVSPKQEPPKRPGPSK